ncbi:hypothetical protein QWY86_15590 [Pedobacter aquatilis]|uniref:hypothetical protein n=1 Tax=Pedobacter aquatilis TaxID=351343 RepID=UPI0025B3C11C|nr:hypothetical protein [Pedobacter aquatilis]MDN3588106.1 hypothetical protein [Pedobacter aquatilis]
MWAKLDFKRKRAALYLLMAFMAYMAWAFSFKNAISAMLLNRELSGKESKGRQQDSASPFVLRKHEFYLGVVKSYKVKQADVEGHIWQVLSGIAVHHAAEISLEPALEVVADTVQQVNAYDFVFKGNYAQLVKVLDSTNASPGIGRLSAIELSRSPLADEPSDQLRLKLRLSVVK